MADPLTDCDSICTDDACAIVTACADYVNMGTPNNCVETCRAGCEKGCIPKGADTCLSEFTDCEALIDCLEPLMSP